MAANKKSGAKGTQPPEHDLVVEMLRLASKANRLAMKELSRRSRPIDGGGKASPGALPSVHVLSARGPVVIQQGAHAHAGDRIAIVHEPIESRHAQVQQTVQALRNSQPELSAALEQLGGAVVNEAGHALPAENREKALALIADLAIEARAPAPRRTVLRALGEMLGKVIDKAEILITIYDRAKPFIEKLLR
ncbi:MAG TPA: hypothetical protein VNO55_01890 [Polyangia bacterium]|nr:hypothetical protein [Polyangia bacterium]